MADKINLEPLVEIMARLRSEGGCVWDMAQTHTSLRRYLVEEVYEVLEAIDRQDAGHICEELGDLLLQIIFHARIAEEAGRFSLQTVIDEVAAKMIRRHPHVFSAVKIKDATEVLVNWEQIKRQEKAATEQRVLAGVPQGLPTLMSACKLQAKAARVGFDWESPEPVWDKVFEELAEFKEAVSSQDSCRQEAELGDLLFAVVDLARTYGIEPETTLNKTNTSFVDRFNYIEDKVREQKLDWKELTLAQLDLWWDEAKAREN